MSKSRIEVVVHPVRSDGRRLALAMIGLMLLLASSSAAQQFQFMRYAPRTPESLWPSPVAISGGFAFGDVDGDGLCDVVVCEGTTLSLMRRLPTGGYSRQRTISGVLSQWPILRDFDGDGALDVLLTAPSPGRAMPLQLLRGQPNAWQTINLLPPSLGPVIHGADIGDIDGDGDLDLVVSPLSGFGRPPLVLLRNPGNGSTAWTVDETVVSPYLPTGMWPRLVDFDRDGDLDIVASLTAGGFVLLRNDGNTFTNASALLPPTRAGYPFHGVGDFDGDGFDDVAASHSSGNLDMLWGTTTGFTFRESVLPATGLPAIAARVLVPQDIDGDGDLDLVAERPGGGLDLLRHVGNRQFVREPVFTEPVATFAVGDVEGDGVSDLVFTPSRFPATVIVSPRARPDGLDAALAQTLAWPPGTVTTDAPGVGDVDGDGRTDMLQSTSAGLVVYLSHGDGTYAVQTQTSVPQWTGEPILADVDGDGDLDLVVVTIPNLLVLRNDGRGVFSSPSTLVSHPLISHLRIADVDGDGDADLVAGVDQSTRLFRNLGAGAFSPATILANGRAPLELVDLDGDGDLDLVAGIPLTAGSGHLLLANDGLGNFAPTPSMTADLGLTPFTVVAADVDGDGDQDLAVGSGFSWARLLTNNGTGTFTDVTGVSLPAALQGALSIVAADIDEDGDIDLFVTIQGIPRLLLNDGTGRFALASSSRMDGSLGSGSFFMAADIDDDGDLDVFRTVAGSSLQSFPPIAINHLRQLRIVAAPHLGGAAHANIFSGPGFSPPGVAALAIAAARSSAPLSLSGFAGKLQLDPLTLQLAAAVPTSSIGVSSAFVTVPNTASLVGLQAWLQAAILPSTGPPGLTNAVYEVVLH